MYGVEAQNRATKEGKASGRSDPPFAISPRASGEAQAPLRNFGKEPVDELEEVTNTHTSDRQARSSRKSSTAIATHLRRLAGNTWDAGPSLPETKLDGWPDLRSVNDVGRKTEGRNHPTTPKPKGRSGETREDNEKGRKHEGRGCGPRVRDGSGREPFDERSARMSWSARRTPASARWTSARSHLMSASARMS